MRIAELSRQTGVPVATIKYYLREGMLPAGAFTSPNQARYDVRHVQRLRLIRALADIARLPIATIRDLLTHVDEPDPDVHRLLGRAMKSAAPTRQWTGEGLASADIETDELIARRGWHVGPDAPGRRTVAEVIAAMRQLGADDVVDLIDEYAEAAEHIAATDLEMVRRRAEPEAMVFGAVVGTILGDILMAGLRRLAQEDRSAKVFGHSHVMRSEEDCPR